MCSHVHAFICIHTYTCIYIPTHIRIHVVHMYIFVICDTYVYYTYVYICYMLYICIHLNGPVVPLAKQPYTSIKKASNIKDKRPHPVFKNPTSP